MNLYNSELTDKEILDHKDYRWRKFCMDMDLMKIRTKKIHKIKMKWNNQKFLKSSKINIPEKQGIYMFVLDVSNGININGTAKYVLYVGQAINLRNRFINYFNYVNSDLPADFLKRCMVLIWKGKLDFHYFETDDLSDKELTDVEFDLIDSLVPPMNQRFRGKVLKKRIKLYSAR